MSTLHARLLRCCDTSLSAVAASTSAEHRWPPLAADASVVMPCGLSPVYSGEKLHRKEMSTITLQESSKQFKLLHFFTICYASSRMLSNYTNCYITIWTVY